MEVWSNTTEKGSNTHWMTRTALTRAGGSGRLPTNAAAIAPPRYLLRSRGQGMLLTKRSVSGEGRGAAIREWTRVLSTARPGLRGRARAARRPRTKRMTRHRSAFTIGLFLSLYRARALLWRFLFLVHTKLNFFNVTVKRHPLTPWRWHWVNFDRSWSLPKHQIIILMILFTFE